MVSGLISWSHGLASKSQGFPSAKSNWCICLHLIVHVPVFCPACAEVVEDAVGQRKVTILPFVMETVRNGSIGTHVLVFLRFYSMLFSLHVDRSAFLMPSLPLGSSVC